MDRPATDDRTSPHPPGGDAPVAVACRDLVVRYGDTVAVDGLSFEARAGEVLALLGPNGAGKTSTVETLEGYRRPDGGSVAVLGADPAGDHATVIPRIGVMLQRGGVYPSLGPARVLRLFAGYYDDPEDPESLLELVGLAEVRRTPWRRLSGGEQQRLSLALALVGRPEVVFLDEPTAGVDPEGRLTVRSVIRSLRDRGVCVVLTTHELTEAERLADRVVIVDHGRAVAEGTPAELAAERSDGSIRFSGPAGLDTGALAEAVGAGAGVTETEPGHYRLEPGGLAVPDALAALTTWLAARGTAVTDLRTGASLEEAYLAVTGGERDRARRGRGVGEAARRGASGRRGRR